MLLSCFSERERLKTGNFSFVGVRTCQCMTKTSNINNMLKISTMPMPYKRKWSNYTERWAEDISSVQGRLLKACINSRPQKVLHPSKRKRHTSAMEIESDLKLTMYMGTKITMNDVYVSTFIFKSRFEKVIVQCWLKCLLM